MPNLLHYKRVRVFCKTKECSPDAKNAEKNYNIGKKTKGEFHTKSQRAQKEKRSDI